MTDYLSLAEVLAIHEDQVRRFAGAQGVRDLGLVEAALFRPQTGYYEDIIEEAAALWESLSQNHAFVDGDKRVAFACTDVFLRMNGLVITARALVAYRHMIKLYENGSFNFENLVKWLRSNSERAD